VSPCSGCETGRLSSPFSLGSATAFVLGLAPLRGRRFGTSRLRHDPYVEWLDGVSHFLAGSERSGLHAGGLPFAFEVDAGSGATIGMLVA
jgi:hypothetical protein